MFGGLHMIWSETKIGERERASECCVWLGSEASESSSQRANEPEPKSASLQQSERAANAH